VFRLRLGFLSRVCLAVVVLMTAFCMTLPTVKAGNITPLDWTSPTTYTLFSVFMVNAADGWAVGTHSTPIPLMANATDECAGGEPATIVHWNGTQWSSVASPTTNNLNSVFMVSAADGWAVGGYGMIIHWDGTQWNNVTSIPCDYLSSVFMVNATDGWTVGGGTIIRWDGVQWSNVASPTTERFNSVFMVSASDGWVAGDSGTIVRWTGTQWIPEFHQILMMPLFVVLTLVSVTVAKRVSKKRRSQPLIAKTQA
jgi:hypothetical protein